MIEFKLNATGLLIYAAMLAYLVAFTALQLRRERAGRLAFGLGFVACAIAFAVRWIEAGHLPMQTLFEVFLCLGLIVFPLSVFCRTVLRAGGESVDALIGFVLLFPAGFIFEAGAQRLPPALQSWLFGPHVLAYILAYVIMFKSSIIAFRQLAFNDSGEKLVAQDAVLFRLVRLGFPLLTLGLVLGAWWGKLAWGDYWNWDPKELWSLATWLVYVGYLHIRSAYGPHSHQGPGARFARMHSALVLVGGLFIVVTLVWVNLAGRIFQGLHSYAT